MNFLIIDMEIKKEKEDRIRVEKDKMWNMVIENLFKLYEYDKLLVVGVWE